MHYAAFEEHVGTKGTKPQSFPYSKFYKGGICYMQLDHSGRSEPGDTPEFTIASNDAVLPQTWSLSNAVSFIAITTALPSASSSTPSSSSSLSSPSRSYTGSSSSSSPSKSLSTAEKIGVSLFIIFGILVLIMTVWFYYAPFRRARDEKREPTGFRPNWWRRWSEFNDTAEIGQGAHQCELEEPSLPELDSAPRFELEAGPERSSMTPPHSSP